MDKSRCYDCREELNNKGYIGYETYSVCIDCARKRMKQSN